MLALIDHTFIMYCLRNENVFSMSRGRISVGCLSRGSAMAHPSGVRDSVSSYCVLFISFFNEILYFL